MPQCDNRFSRLCDRPPFIVNSVIVWARRTRPAPRRISSESRRGSRMRLEGSAGGSVAWRLPDCGSKYPGARARHRPRRGVGYQFVSSVSPSLCSTFFSRVGP